jgi:hypothetical protein
MRFGSQELLEVGSGDGMGEQIIAKGFLSLLVV